MKLLRSKLTYANVVSTLCLFILLGGGTAYAAKTILASGSVGTRQLKAGAVTAPKLSKSLARQITAGAPSYYAHVYDGAFEGPHPGFVSLSNPNQGVYCLTVAAGVSRDYPLASPDWWGSYGFDLLVEPIAAGAANAYCAAGQLAILTYDFSIADSTDATLSNAINYVVYLPQPGS